MTKASSPGALSLPLVGAPSVENSLGVFPSSGGLPAARPSGSDPEAANGFEPMALTGLFLLWRPLRVS